MSKIAIDVVIIPPENIIDLAVEMNNQFENDPIKLNKENCLPHLSLCMGVIEEQDLSKIKSMVQKIIKEFPKLSLTIEKIKSGSGSFEIKKNEVLQELHEKIMSELSPYLSYDAELNMCFSPHLVLEKTLSWINNYRDNWSFDNFYPHITLGTSKRDLKEINIDFVASNFAIFQLGNYCTCGKIIESFKSE